MATKRNNNSKTPAPKIPAKAGPDKSAADIIAAEPAVVETPVRKSVMPKASPAGAPIAVTKSKAPVPLTYEKIAERAYYISQSGRGGSEDDNWLRAEAELKLDV